MGLFDRFKKKITVENKVTTEDNSAQNKHVTVTKELESKYKDYQEDLYFIKKECEIYNLDYKSLLERYNLKEKSKEEYFETYSFNEDLDIRLKIDKILRYIRVAKESLNEIKHNDEEIPQQSTQYKYSSNIKQEFPKIFQSENNSVLSRIEQNSPETYQRVDEHMFNSVIKLEELLEKEKKQKQEELINQISKELKDDSKFKEISKNYNSSKNFIRTVIKEMEEMYKISKLSDFNLLGENNNKSKRYLKEFCLLDEQERNAMFFKHTFSEPSEEEIEKIKNENNIGNIYLAKKNMARLKAIEYYKDNKDLVAKKYKITSKLTSNEFFENWCAEYSKYILYQLKIMEVVENCKNKKIDYAIFAYRHGIEPFIGFEEFYNHPNNSTIATTLDNALSSEIKNNQKLLNLLENDERFKNNIKNNDGLKFIIHIKDILTKVYNQTKDEAYNPNDETNIKMFCLMTNEERKENFRNAISSVSENKGLK